MDVVYLIVLGEPFVEEGEFRPNEIGDREVGFYQVVEEGACFFEHRPLQVAVILGEELVVGIREIDLAQVEPGVGEVGDETFGVFAR